MRRARILAAVLLVLATIPVPTASAASPPLRIAEILPNPDAALGQQEFVELLNIGTGAVDLTGWKLRDAPTASGSQNTFTFPAVSLAPGDRLVVRGGDGGAGGLAWSQAAAWNNAGDAVHLIDADGQLVDWVDYGATMAPPAGSTSTGLAAPAKGQSMSWTDGGWAAATPSPGLAAPASGQATASVSNVPPVVELRGPDRVDPGSELDITVTVSDPNGGSDVTGWTLRAGDATVASGTGAADRTVRVTAPATGPWALLLEASDAAGATASVERTLAVARVELKVDLPDAGLVRFPQFTPGARDVAALDEFAVRNDGDAAVRPRIDVSAFSGPGGAFPASGNLRLHLDGAVIEYAGPMTELPELGPGDAWSVRLEIVAVPTPLAAGDYGTSFAVVA